VLIQKQKKCTDSFSFIKLAESFFLIKYADENKTTTGMKLPIGIQDFESLRIDGYAYVDKTEQIYRLISEGRYYFLSRPRRFGKSLLITTLKAMFLGKRELFKGLAIDQKEDWEWAVHPVMHLDLNTEKYDSKETLSDRLNLFLSGFEKTYGRNEAEKSLGARSKSVKSVVGKEGWET
jgi:hypothetical protein